jgi:hypothetical protein
MTRGSTRWLAGALVAGTLASPPVPAHAIILHAWTFQELAGVSDVVLVVERVSVRDSGRRTRVPPPGYRFTATPPVESAEWEAQLKVLLQLMPDPKAGSRVPPQIRMRYFRTERGGGCISCPAEIDLSGDKGRHYLVFLKRVALDLFEPASKDDMAIDAVFSLEHTGGWPIQWETYLPTAPPPPPRK